MSFKAPVATGGQKFAPQKNITPGTYPARVVQLIDYGLQAQRSYKGEEKKPAIEIGVTYELVDEFMKDDQGNELKESPRWISESFPYHPLIAEKAKSTQRYHTFDPTEAWGGDFSQALGKPVNVTIVNNKNGDKVYDNVATISAMRPKDAENCPALVDPPVLFSLDDPDINVFNKLPKWISDKIKGNLNFNGSKLQAALGGKVEAAPNNQTDSSAEAGNNPY